MVAKRNLDLFNKVIPAIDKKDFGLYDRLSDDEKKEFAALVIMRWGVNVDINDPIILHYYLASFNHYANKKFFNLHKHPKLQWMLIAAASPNLGTHRRKWIGSKKKKDTKSEIRKELKEMYPTYKEEDIEMLTNITSKKDIKDFKKDCGLD